MVDLEATADFAIAQTRVGRIGKQFEKPDLQIAEGSSICLQHRWVPSQVPRWVVRASRRGGVVSETKSAAAFALRPLSHVSLLRPMLRLLPLPRSGRGVAVRSQALRHRAAASALINLRPPTTMTFGARPSR